MSATNATETLYHSEIGLPAGFIAPVQKVSLRWTQHAIAESTKDRYAIIPMRDTMTLEWYDVVEVGMRNGAVSKIVFRGGMDKDNDIVIVLIPNGSNPWTVKTCWINKKNDSHKTLDRSKYQS